MKRGLIGLLIVMFLLTACSSATTQVPLLAKDGSYENEIQGMAPAAELNYGVNDRGVAAPMPTMAASSGEPLGSGQPAPDRIVIRNADLSIVVDDPTVALDAIVKMAERMGGFVVNSNLYKTNTSSGNEVPEAYITIRVPAESLNAALAEIKNQTSDPSKDVLSENVSGQDVTKEYTDLNSRLKNLEDAETQLRRIMEEATKTEDVLNVFNQLTYYREQIEVTKGQIRYYEESSALSAISIRIQAKEAIQPITVAGWTPVGVARDAIQALINAAQFLVDAFIWILLLVVPVLILIFIPIYLVYLLIRAIIRRQKRKNLEKIEVVEETPSTEDK